MTERVGRTSPSPTGLPLVLPSEELAQDGSHLVRCRQADLGAVHRPHRSRRQCRHVRSLWSHRAAAGTDARQARTCSGSLSRSTSLPTKQYSAASCPSRYSSSTRNSHPAPWSAARRSLPIRALIRLGSGHREAATGERARPPPTRRATRLAQPATTLAAARARLMRSSEAPGDAQRKGPTQVSVQLPYRASGHRTRRGPDEETDDAQDADPPLRDAPPLRHAGRRGAGPRSAVLGRG